MIGARAQALRVASLVMSSPPRSLRLPGLPPIRVSAATLVMVAILVLLLQPAFARLPGVGMGGALLATTALALGLVLAIALHEIAHALVARASGAQVDHIALTLWGGHTTYRARRVGTIASILISLAGPATNLLIAGAATLLQETAAPGGVLHLFWSLTATLNLTLAIFNLLPGLPMDGGRALESLLQAILRSPRTGTVVTAWIGRAIAVAVVAVPLLRVARGGGSASMLLLVWAVIIAGTLWQGASEALRTSGIRERVREISAQDLVRPVLLLPAEAPLLALRDAVPHPGAAGARAPVLLVQDAQGRAGTPDADAVQAVPRERWAEVPLSAVTTWIGPLGRVREDLDGEELVEELSAAPRALHLVEDRAGRIVGVITTADVNAHLSGHRPRLER